MIAVQNIALMFILLMCLNSTFAENSLIDNYDNGKMDWAAHTIMTQGRGEYNPNLTPAQFRLSGIRDARIDAEKNLLNILMSLNYTCDKTVRAVMLKSIESANRIEELVKQYQIIDKPRLMPDSSIVINIEFRFSRELIDELVKVSENNTDSNNKRDELSMQFTSVNERFYIDCRGYSIEPAIAPKITNLSGGILFSLSIMDYSAFENGVPFKYISQLMTGSNEEDISFDNLDLIKVIKVDKCNIIIDDIDYDKLISSEDYNKALKNSQVIILVD